jgi:arylsulfatase A-like enzyme
MLLVLLGTVLSSAPAAGAPKPNIMLVVADDLGYNDVGFEEPNYSFVQTPHLTTLAKKGVRCRRSFCGSLFG